MISRVILFGVFFACWFVFSGRDEPLYLIFGAISSLIATYVAVKIGGNEAHRLNRGVFRYWFWLLGQILLSGKDVVMKVWSIKPNIQPQFIEIPTTQDTPIGYTIYGNSITLTPGTVTVSVNTEKNKIVVHALTKAGVESLKNGEMDKRVKKICG